MRGSDIYNSLDFSHDVCGRGKKRLGKNIFVGREIFSSSYGFLYLDILIFDIILFIFYFFFLRYYKYFIISFACDLDFLLHF